LSIIRTGHAKNGYFSTIFLVNFQHVTTTAGKSAKLADKQEETGRVTD
jgi:hypothetical protein